MSASNSFETAMLLLYFNNTNHANVGDATGLRGSTAWSRRAGRGVGAYVHARRHPGRRMVAA